MVVSSFEHFRRLGYTRLYNCRGHVTDIISFARVAQLRNRIKRIVQNAIFDSSAVTCGRSFQTRRTKMHFMSPVMVKITTL